MIDLEKEGIHKRGKRKDQEKVALGIKDEISFSKYGNQDDIWLSRSAFDDFKKCKRCFYLIRKKGFISPGTPQFTMNSTTDKLLKKEFDLLRKDQKSHQILIEKNLDHIVPYRNEEVAINIYGDPIIPFKSKIPYEKMEAWRSNYHGLQTRFKKTNFILYGSVDDIWFDTKNNSLIIADYKSQANEKEVTQETYWDGDFKTGYQRQLDFYFYLLKQQNLKETISNDAYLLVVNARGLEDKFDNKLLFESTLVHTKVKDDDLENEIQEMIDVFNSDNVPESNKLCKNCAYARQRSVIDKL
jgi:CRISPR/Cas system-associated exonuclease Cas4 (RecB family)